jgi:Holliday junction DNA helicase RuvB
VSGRTDALRPTELKDFGGQPDLVRNLEFLLTAAKQRGQVCDHILFSGPPGLGKTTLSQIVAHELGLPLLLTSAPAIEKPGDIAALLSSMTRSSVVFVDEIHRLDPKAEELLYSAMEDGRIDFVVGEGANAVTVPLELRPFVLVGATTQSGRLSAPLRDRFGFVGRLKLYSDEDLASIVLRSAELLEVDVTPEAALALAARSRGTPRVANTWLRRVRDWVQVKKIDVVDEPVALEALANYGVDSMGLDPLGQEILRALVTSFRGGPVGLTTLAASVDEAPATLEEEYEPYMMRKGLLSKTPRGRVATAAAYEHLGLAVPSTLKAGPEPLSLDLADVEGP